MASAIRPVEFQLPSDVLRLATEQGVATYLPAVVEMTREVFPKSSLMLVVEEDPEIADDQHIVVKVLAEGLPVSEALEKRYQWHEGLFTRCPAPLACAFRLALRLTS